MTVKKGFIAAITLFLMLTLPGCDLGALQNILPAPTPEPVVSTPEPTPEPGLTLEQQKGMIMGLYDTWKPVDETFGWSYAITDLDANGRCEVIAASLQGTGLYTYADFYEINETYSGLEKCRFDVPEGFSQADIMTDTCQCYYDPATDTRYYIISDILRFGAAGYSYTTYAVSLKDGVVREDAIAFEGVEMGEGAEPVHSYYDAAGNETTKELYDSAATDFGKNMELSFYKFSWTKVEPPAPENSPEIVHDPKMDPQNPPVETNIVITKNPSGENVEIGGHTWFIATAENSDYTTWMMYDPAGTEHSLEEAMELVPGVGLTKLDDTTLAVTDVTAGLNGWAAFARFNNDLGSLDSTAACIYVEDYAAAYADVMNYYRALAAGQTGEEYGFNISSDLDMTGLGYKLKDLDANGVPELIVARISKTTGTRAWDDIIYSVFTIEGGRPVCILHSFARDRFYYTGLGFLEEGSSGASNSVNYIYQIENGALKLSEGLCLDGMQETPYFIVSADGALSPISEDVFNSIMLSYEAMIKPLGQLTAF